MKFIIPQSQRLEEGVSWKVDLALLHHSSGLEHFLFPAIFKSHLFTQVTIFHDQLKGEK